MVTIVTNVVQRKRTIPKTVISIQYNLIIHIPVCIDKIAPVPMRRTILLFKHLLIVNKNMDIKKKDDNIPFTLQSSKETDIANTKSNIQ
jgi:hypothetical protein